jgi:hypothetical protein
LSRIYKTLLPKKTVLYDFFRKKGEFATEYFTFRKLCYLVAIFRPKKKGLHQGRFGIIESEAKKKAFEAMPDFLTLRLCLTLTCSNQSFSL